MSMVWAHVIPFVALQFYSDSDKEEKDAIMLVLVCSACLWLLLNIAFFCTIDLSYLSTFFGTKTASQYTCEYFLTSTEDFQKWDAVFENRIDYTKSIHEDVKVWVAENVSEWKEEKPDWFNLSMFPDDLLPRDVLADLGGSKRRKSLGGPERGFLDSVGMGGSLMKLYVESAAAELREDEEVESLRWSQDVECR